MKKVTIVAVVPIIGAGLALTSRLNADEWDKLTTVKFSGPVEIPGQVLPAGSYVFKLLDSPSSRNIVQIFDARSNKLRASILAIPDYPLKPTAKP